MNVEYVYLILVGITQFMNINQNSELSVKSNKITLSKKENGYKINFKCLELDIQDRDKLNVHNASSIDQMKEQKGTENNMVTIHDEEEGRMPQISLNDSKQDIV